MVTETQNDSPSVALRPPARILPDAAGDKTTVDVSLQYYTYAAWQFPDRTVYILGRTDQWSVHAHGAIVLNVNSPLGFRYTALKNPQGQVDNKNTGTTSFKRLNSRRVGPNNDMEITPPSANEADPSWQ